MVYPHHESGTDRIGQCKAPHHLLLMIWHVNLLVRDDDGLMHMLWRIYLPFLYLDNEDSICKYLYIRFHVIKDLVTLHLGNALARQYPSSLDLVNQLPFSIFGGAYHYGGYGEIVRCMKWYARATRVNVTPQEDFNFNRWWLGVAGSMMAFVNICTNGGVGECSQKWHCTQ